MSKISVMISILIIGLLDTCGLTEEWYSYPTVTQDERDALPEFTQAADCPLAPDSLYLSLNFTISSGHASDAIQETACTIQYVEVIASHYPELATTDHLGWLLLGVARYGRDTEALRELVPHFTKNELLDQAYTLSGALNSQRWVTEDEFGCLALKGQLVELYDLAQDDPISDLCEQIKEHRLGIADIEELHELLPFEGECSSRFGEGSWRVMTLAENLAARVEGNEDAFRCMLNKTQANLDLVGSLDINDHIILYVAFQRGMMSESRWNLAKEASYIPQDALEEIAQEQYAILLNPEN